jgi:hypothetical protein
MINTRTMINTARSLDELGRGGGPAGDTGRDADPVEQGAADRQPGLRGDGGPQPRDQAGVPDQILRQATAEP